MDISPDAESKEHSVLLSEFNFGDKMFHVDRTVRLSQLRRKTDISRHVLRGFKMIFPM